MRDKMLRGSSSIFQEDQPTKRLQAAYEDLFRGDLPRGVPKRLVDNVETQPGAPITAEELREFLRRDLFYPALLCYRPVHTPHTKITGAEVLPRVIPPHTRDIEGTSRFAEVAAKENAWPQISACLIHHAARIAQACPDLHLSLNLSQRMIDLGDSFVDDVVRTLELYGVPHGQFGFEVLENVDGIDYHRAALLDRLKELGFELALDDYGDGNSYRLLEDTQDHGIPLNRLKLASHVTASAGNGKTKIRHHIERGRNAGIRNFVAEGSFDHPISTAHLDGLRQMQEEFDTADIQVEGPVIAA